MGVSGTVEAGYEPIQEIFSKLVEDGRETGAGLSIWRGGKEVVVLNGGWADAARTRPWTEDTLVHTYSTSKPFAALAGLAAVARGEVPLDEPIAQRWTAYSAAGKGETTLRDILTHRAGLPAFPPSSAAVDLVDEEGLIAALAAASPESKPGTVVAEHALTYGHLIDGVLRAWTGHSLGEWFANVVRPALDLDAWFGVLTEDLPRVADLEHALPGGAAQMVTDVAPTYDRSLALPEGAMEPDRINSTAFRQSAFGAMGLHASARALARFYGSLTDADGPVRRLLGAELHEGFVTTQVCEFDETIGARVNWTLGCLRTDAFVGLGGFGGSAAYWSYTNDHALAYVTRRLHDHSRVGEIAFSLGDNLNKVV